MKSQEMSKEELLQSEFGQALQECAAAYDKRIEKLGNPRYSIESKEKRKGFSKAQMQVFCLALKHMYGIEYKFISTSKYYGVATLDGKHWLFMVKRDGILQECPQFFGDNGEVRFCRFIEQQIRIIKTTYKKPARLEYEMNFLRNICAERGVSEANMELLFGGNDDAGNAAIESL